MADYDYEEEVDLDEEEKEKKRLEEGVAYEVEHGYAHRHGSYGSSNAQASHHKAEL